MAPLAIQSRAQADEALREIGELKGRGAELQQRCDRAVAVVLDHWAQRMTVRVDGADVPFGDRIRELEADLEAFVLRNVAALFEAGKKSIDLNHGTLGVRPSQPAVIPLEGMTESQALEKLSGAFMTRIRKLLTSARLGFGKANDSVLRLKAEINRSGILARYRERAITDQQLAKAGLRIRPATDVFFYEATEQEVEHQSAEPLSA